MKPPISVLDFLVGDLPASWLLSFPRFCMSLTFSSLLSRLGGIYRAHPGNFLLADSFLAPRPVPSGYSHDTALHLLIKFSGIKGIPCLNPCLKLLTGLQWLGVECAMVEHEGSSTCDIGGAEPLSLDSEQTCQGTVTHTRALSRCSSQGCSPLLLGDSQGACVCHFQPLTV